MSDSFQNDPSEAARKRLREACKTKDTSLRVAWAVTIGEGLLVGVAAVALMDYWWMLPMWIRSLSAVGLGALAAFGIYRLARFYRRPTPLKEAALDAEAARPELGCEISTAAEYISGERQVTHQYEPELVKALEAKAANELGRMQVPYAKRLLRPALILGVTFLGLAAFLLAKPVSWTALRRVAFPFSKVLYTQLDVAPGNIEIPVGSDVTITNVFTGRVPKDPQLHWAQAGEWQNASLITRSSDGAYLYTFKNVRTDLDYRVTGNDAVSETYQIRIYVPPEVKELSVQIEYPSYTHLKPSTQKSGDITAVRASKVQIQVEPSVKLSKASVRFSNQQPELLLQAATNGLWMGTFTINKDTDYWIELADAKGHRGGDREPHHIKAVPDLPPKVEIEDPGQDMRASATNHIPLTISVADDFGVDNVRVTFHKLGAPGRTLTATPQPAPNGQVTASAELDLSALELKDYDVVAYQAEAKDNNTLDGPGVGKSPVYFVEINNLEGKSNQPQPAQGKKLNLLALQKQIIADTTALTNEAPADKFGEIATRQKDAADFGNIYLKSLTGAGAPAAALTEMKSALSDMTNATARLTDHKRTDALPPEEGALAHLYQVLKELPELQDMPTQPKPPKPPNSTNMLAVVLEAIRKAKPPTENPDIQDALQQAQQLADAQAQLNAALRNQADAQAQGQGQGQGQGSAKAKAPQNKDGQGDKPDQGDKAGKGDGEGKEDALAKADDANASQDQASKADDQNQGKGKGQGKGKEKGQGKGKGEGQGQGQGQGKGKGQGKGQGQGDGKAQDQEKQDPADQQMAEQPKPDQPDQLAEQEQQLSKQVSDLEKKLQELAGKDKRLGNNAGQNAHLGAQKIATASQEARKGNFGAAGVNGFEGEVALRKVVTQLQRAGKEKPEYTDAASEEAPKQYEPLISEYFKTLSHAE